MKKIVLKLYEFDELSKDSQELIYRMKKKGKLIISWNKQKGIL